jgi:3-hydroxyisobutyrate dehydrogenase-like beta-hydroxyacid dehydrogenase
MTSSEHIGFIGLGAMGYGMAQNILAKSGQINVIANRDREPVENLLARGATEYSTYRALAENCDIILLCLPNSKVVEAVIEQITPGMRAGQLLIDTGTSSLLSTKVIAEQMQSLSVNFAESPLTGGVDQANAGELGALVGCEASLFDMVRTVMGNCCSAVQHFGDVGAGGRAKFVNNYMVFGIAAVVFEAFHIADITGSDWEKLYDVVIRGSADSGVFRRVIGNAINDDYKGYVFDVNGALKDMTYITEMNEDLGHRSALNNAVLELFERAKADGLGNLMISELMRPEIRAQRNGV